MCDYYKLERALLSYIPHKLTDRMQEDLDLSISHYDEFNKCPMSGEQNELYNLRLCYYFKKHKRL